MGNPEGKRPLRRPRCRWEDIKMDLREIWWGGIDWIHLALDRDQWKAVVTTVRTFEVHKMLGKFLNSVATGGFPKRTQLCGVTFN
jgi:hypothetical protein